MMYEKKMNQKTMKIKTAVVFFITFLIVTACAYFLNRNQEREEKLKAAYTAEATVGRVETQLNKYLAVSDFLKRLVENGYHLDDKEYAELSRMARDENGVIEAIEMAPDGVVKQMYPVKGNEAAYGLDMLQNIARKQEANLAKDSGRYTIAGPFALVQGGMGALLFDPIYVRSGRREKTFWGFSILVINWERFIDEIALDKLEEAGYHYRIWKKDMESGEKIVLAQSSNLRDWDTLEVACSVPNDIWYFEICQENGWIIWQQVVFEIVLAIVLAALGAIAYWQFWTWRNKEIRYAQDLEMSAKKARAANGAKTRFLFNMSHDIRTPMNAIIGFAELMEEHMDDREKLWEYVRKIESSSKLLLSIINYVLEMAQIESGKLELRTESGWIRELISSLNAVFEPEIQKKNLSYRCMFEVKHEYIICDMTKVREILLNIISNSIKYTPEGGHIRLEVRELDLDRSGYASYQIVVQDDGIGMSKEYLPHIFEEFTRERTTTESRVVGTGLGLPIVKALVDVMGGTIEVESKLGEGTKTTLRLIFPLAQETHKGDKDRSVVSMPPELQGKRILLTEDNDLNAEIAMTLLQEHGFQVERAEDGAVCIERLEEHPENYFDVVLMDIQMPNMDGYKATEAIRQLPGKLGKIPVIAMTANAFEEDRRKARAAGMNAYIAKPINMEEMFAALKKVLELKTVPGAAADF